MQVNQFGHVLVINMHMPLNFDVVDRKKKQNTIVTVFHIR